MELIVLCEQPVLELLAYVKQLWSRTDVHSGPVVFTQQLREDLASQSLVGHMHEDHRSNEVHALGVTDLWIQDQCVHLEQIVQLVLTCGDLCIQELERERSERTVNIENDLV